MGKKHSKTKKQKPFNPIRNAEKLFELRPKLKKNSLDNDEREPDAPSSLPKGKGKLMFSEEDREIVLSIREMFSNKGEMPKYKEKFNAISVPIEGDFDIHPLHISCCHSVLRIFSEKHIDANNISEEVLKHVMDLNFRINMGSFYYLKVKDCFVFRMTVPLYEKPEKAFVEGLVEYVIDILDVHVPEILSCVNEIPRWNKEKKSPTFH